MRKPRSFSSRKMDWLILRLVPKMERMSSMPLLKVYRSFTSIISSKISTHNLRSGFLFKSRTQNSPTVVADNITILKLTIKNESKFD